MIIDEMTTTDKIEYYKKLLELERLTLTSVTEQRNKLKRELTENCKRYEIACETAAKMHAAAVGETNDPNLTNPVQDILDLRRERDITQKALFSAVEDYEKAVEQRDEAVNNYETAVLREHRMQEQRDRLADELDALKQSMLDLSHPNMQLLLEERKEAREQRDRLAEELKEAQNAIEMMLKDSSCRRIPACTKEQLAAVKGGQS
jgi:hypothetical protein